MKVPVATLFALGLAGIAAAQTPPQKPNTTPIPATPPLELPNAPTPDELSTKPISADDAAAIALKLQPNVTVALADAAAARAQVNQAVSKLLPTASFSTQYEWQFLFHLLHGGTSSSGNGLVTGISMQQLLFDFDKTMDSVRQARASAKAAEYNLTAVQADLVFQVKQQFYTVVQNRQLVDVFDADVKSSKDQLDLTVAELSVGLGVPSDVVTANANLANAVTSLVQARETYLLSRVTLAALIGVDPRTPLQLAKSDEPANDSSDLNALVDSGLKNRPEVLEAEESLRAAGYAVSVARKSYLPTIDLTATASTPSINGFLSLDNGAIAIVLNWNFWDSGLTSAEIAQAKANALAAKASLVSQTQTVVSDVSSAYVSLQSAKQRVEVASSAVANAQEGLRLSEGRYKAGVTTFVEITQAQATLVTAESTQAQAEASLEIARAQMSKAIGAPVKAPKPADLKPIQPGK